MSEKPVALLVRPRGQPIKNLPKETYATPSDPCEALYLRVSAKSKFPLNRLRLTKASDGSHIPNAKDVTVEQMGLYEQSMIYVKDLGPQIAWRTVFIIEYLGPLLLHPLLYLLRPYIYRNDRAPLPFPAASTSATLSMWMITLHFLKREYETVFVHRFSASTMPMRNIFKNSAHYWLLAGLNIALFTYSPSDAVPTSHPPPYSWIQPLAILLYTVGELANLSTHLTLRGLRRAGSTDRGVPDSWAWQVTGVTCPNYFFETMAWIGIWLANRSLSTGLFVIVAVGQMALWARKKEKRYRSEFGSKYRRRRFAMLPGIV